MATLIIIGNARMVVTEPYKEVLKRFNTSNDITEEFTFEDGGKVSVVLSSIDSVSEIERKNKDYGLQGVPIPPPKKS